ncbi:MAG: adenylosuccinate synthase [Candidatus Uhrbacteria bacterium]|nr:adenylosuccinate synthase [Candidatus Uhrbacteria bacterium]
MGAIVILGAQFGDEGKGKISDVLAKDAHVVARFQGGGNAGHTLVIGDRTIALHLLPSGICHEDKMNIVGPGVVCDLEVLVQELALAREFGSRVLLDEQTPIVLPIHRMMDAVREVALGARAIGSTKRGIGPAYSDFWLRRSVTLGDLRSADSVRAVLTRGRYMEEMFGAWSLVRGEQIRIEQVDVRVHPMHLDDTIDLLMSFADRVVPHIGDTRACVHRALDDGKNVLFEGAQGVMLDAYHGSRPFVTSSLCTSAGVSATFGVHTFDRVIGVAKAYPTRVGAGPFPTELQDERGEELRRRGHEFGTTTGRPRRCGYLDLPALRQARRVSGIEEFVITKLDILTDLEDLFVCDHYIDVDDYTTLTCSVLENAKPHLLRMPGWNEDLSNCRHYKELPAAARAYIELIEKQTGTVVSGIGVGAERNQILWR